MKHVLLLLLLFPTVCSAQLVFEVNAPSIERGVFPCMAGAASEWPNSPDLYQNGNWFSDTLILADDGTLGSACNALNNSVVGNFALVYRSGCSLGQSLLNAQNAGATAAVVIDSVDGRPLPFEPDALSSSITIPFVIISRGKGDSLIQRMAENEIVVASFGDKTGVNTTDLGMYKEFSLWSRYGIFPFEHVDDPSPSNNQLPDKHFGTWVYNQGITDASNVQVKLWFYHDPNYPLHNQDSLSLPFDLAAGDSVFIDFDFEYEHGTNYTGSSISKSNPLNYGYELITPADDDTLDNKISQIIYSAGSVASNSFSPGDILGDFSEVDYFIEGSPESYDSIGYCVYMPLKMGVNHTYLYNPIAPIVGSELGAEESVILRDAVIGNQQMTFGNLYESMFYYVGNINEPIYSDYPSPSQPFIDLDTNIVMCINTNSSTKLGFSSDMYHDEQIRQGYLPTYFRKVPYSTGSNYDAQYIITPVISLHFCNYPSCEINSVEEIEAPQISLFPNPARSALTIQSEEIIETITVFDVFGKKVLSVEAAGTLEQTVDVEALHPGTYLVEVVGEGRSVGRFVKE